jgi:raffinose/stachyose/melibiose transport system substrate-binding protein
VRDSEDISSLRGAVRRISARISGRRVNDPLREVGDISWGNRFAVVLVVTTFLVSLFYVTFREHKTSGHKVVLTLAHWQLEYGVKDGLDYMAEKYNQELVRQGKEPIEFRQMPIPETGYAQWVTTQLMGGTPPDLIEMGQMSWDAMIRYHAYYMVPVTAEIFKPNPYNKGTDLENVDWKSTYEDGMGDGIRELKEYYDVGFSSFTVRLYYNKELLSSLSRKLFEQGKISRPLQEPPQDFREFLKLCDLIHEMKDESGRVYLPIAGSQYQYGIMNWQIVDPLSSVLLKELDTNFDCFASSDETFMAIAQGKLSFNDPRIKKVVTLSAELAKRFPPGWKGLSRDEGVMQFVQWRSVFIATGSWDGSTLIEQARMSRHPFEVGISRFPVVKKSDPEYGDISWGRPYEYSGMGFPFALTKACKHPEVALDFMRFLTSRKNNEEFNNKIGWIPVIKGAQPSGFLSAFKPNFYGVKSGWQLGLGNKSQTVRAQTDPLLQLGEDTTGKPYCTDDWCRDMSEKWLNAAVVDFEQRDEGMRDNLPAKETVVALLRSKMLLKNNPKLIDYYQKRYFGAVWDPLNAPRGISELQKKVAEARKEGLIK